MSAIYLRLLLELTSEKLTRRSCTQKMTYMDEKTTWKKLRLWKKKKKMYCTCGQSLSIEEPIHVLLVVTKAGNEISRLSLVETIIFLHYQQARVLLNTAAHCGSPGVVTHVECLPLHQQETSSCCELAQLRVKIRSVCFESNRMYVQSSSNTFWMGVSFPNIFYWFFTRKLNTFWETYHLVSTK